ncbi:MAG: hypothetical protein WC238_04745 [Parcubacteria group bacterium]|jgi:hypothetical protein
MSKKEIFTCDIHGCTNEAHLKQIPIQVIFTTEQTEGCNVEPYLSTVTMDICEEHMKYLLTGHYIFANGAQGFNEYNLTINSTT